MEKGGQKKTDHIHKQDVRVTLINTNSLQEKAHVFILHQAHVSSTFFFFKKTEFQHVVFFSHLS